jgi:hypothetical protein
MRTTFLFLLGCIGILSVSFAQKTTSTVKWGDTTRSHLYRGLPIKNSPTRTVDIVPGGGEGGGGTATYAGNASLSMSDGTTSASITCGGSADLSIAIEETNTILEPEDNLNGPYTVVYQDDQGHQFTLNGYNSGDLIPILPSSTTSYSLSTVTDKVGALVKPDGTPTVTVSCPATIKSIDLVPPPGYLGATNASSLQYTVIFSAPVTGVNATNFTIATTGQISDTRITGVSGNGTNTLTVAVNTGLHDGILTLQFTNADGVSPVITSSLPVAASGVTIDKTPPSIHFTGPTPSCYDAATLPASATNTIVWDIQFQDPGSAGNTLSILPISSTGSTHFTGTLSQKGPLEFNLTVSQISGTGTIFLMLPAGMYTDQAGNPSPALGPVAVATVVGAPGVSIAADAANNTTCAGSLVTFTATPSSGGDAPTYQWMVNESNVGTNSANFSTSSLQDGDKVSVQMVSGSPCADQTPVSSNVVTMAVNELPTILLSQAPTICTGEIGFLMAGSNAATPVFTWSGDAAGQQILGDNSGNFNSPILTTSTRFYVSVKDGTTGCTSLQASDLVTVLRPPTAVLSAPDQVCSGQPLSLSIQFGGDGPWNYEMDNLVPLSSSTNSVTIPVSPISNNASYSITHLSNAGCSGQTQDPLTVLVNPLPTISAGSQPAVCAGSAATLTVSSDASSPVYQWYDQAQQNVLQTGGTGSFITPALSGPATYYVSVKDAATGCTSSALLAMAANVNPSPTFGGVYQTMAVCDGSQATIILSGLLPSTSQTVSYTIAGGATQTVPVLPDENGNASFNITLIYAADLGQTLTVTGISVTNGSSVCSQSLTTNNTVALQVNPLPTAAITAVSMVTAASTGNQATVASTDAGATFAWTISNGTITSTLPYTNTITYTAGASGPVTLNVSVTGTGGCGPVNGSINITVTALKCPEPRIKVPVAVCSNSAGNIATITDGSGGTSDKYSWTITNGAISAGTGTAAITFTAAAGGKTPVFNPANFVQLSAKVSNASGVCTVSTGTYLVYISPYPSATITAATSVCSSSSGNWARVPIAGLGASYAWTITGGKIASGAGTSFITYQVNATGTVTLSVTVTSIGGCKTVSTPKTVSIVPLPTGTITASASICGGSGGNAASVAGSGAKYTWSITGGAITSGNGTTGIKFTAGNLGKVNLFVTVTSGAGCKASGTKAVTITTATKPTFASFGTICQNSQAPALPSKSTNGISGTWNPTSIGTTTTGTKNYVFTPATGTCAVPVSVSITVTKCMTKAAAVITEDPTAEKTTVTDDAASMTANVFPNPSTGNFTLQLKSDTHEAIELRVLDLMGHTMHHARGDANGTYVFGNNFIAGIYFAEIIYQKKIRVLKLIKQ